MERILEYFVSDDAINMFVISPGRGPLAVVTVRYRYDDLAHLVDRFRQSIMHRLDPESAGSVVEDLLLRPLRERGLIADGDNLCIAPHRCLRSLPFSAIGAGDRRAVFLNPIAYIPTGAMVPLLFGAASATGSAVVVRHNVQDDGPEIRESFRSEAEQVARLLNATVWSGEKATEEMLREMSTARILHFTCHAQFDPHDRQRSGVVIPDGHGGDRLMTIDEFASLSICAEHVTFGGCDTGRARPHPGDDGHGLVRAALTAGARSVLATLWPVDSQAAARILPAFYEHWLEGYSRSESLRIAQATLALTQESHGDSDDAARIEHWAPYFIAGNWR